MADEKQKQEAQNIVDQHRKMVVMTGNISDFQIQNLKSWPYLVFGDALEKVEIDYKFVKGNEETGDMFAGEVNFDFTFNKEPKYPGHATGLLTHWTKYLFWEDTKVTFSKEGKEWQT